MRWGRWIVLGFAVSLIGAQISGCDQMPPIDQNFDSSVGEDFKAPAADSSQDAGSAAADAATAP
jgi:hypothetical protein